MSTTLNFATAPGHQVLAAAGKRILRPGGKAATEKLLTWANFQPGETILELAASFGESAIAIAQRFNVRVVGVEKNSDSVAKARENIESYKCGVVFNSTKRISDTSFFVPILFRFCSSAFFKKCRSLCNYE